MTIRIVKQIGSYFSSEGVSVETEDYPTELDAVDAYNWDSRFGESEYVSIEEVIEVLNDEDENVIYNVEYL